MKSNSMLSFLLYAVLPFIIIIFLFKINKIAGLAGVLVYLLAVIVKNLSLIYRLRAQMEYSRENIQKAEKWFGKAANSKNAGVDVLVNYGFILFKEGKLKESEEIFIKAMNKSHSQDDKNLVKSNLALVIWKKGDLDKAYDMLKEVIAEYKNTAVYGSLGYLAIEKGDLDEALKVNLEAYDYNPENAIILDNLAHLYHLRGEMDKAGELFDKLIKKVPHFPEAYYDYGKFLEDTGKADEACDMYRKALKCPFNFNNTITREQVQKALDELTSKLS